MKYKKEYPGAAASQNKVINLDCIEMKTDLERNRIKTVSLMLVVLKVLLILCLLCTNSFAQNEEISFTHFTSEDGLSISYATKILQDKKGFIWIGTQNGLNRFDGYDFKIFVHEPQNESTITSGFINTLCEDRYGCIWVGTPNGLCVYDNKTEKFKRYLNDPKNPRSISNDYIFSIIEDKAGTIWIGTLNGLNKFNRSTNDFTVYKKVVDRLNPDFLNSVTHILEDEKNNLWLATWNGLAYIDKNCKLIKLFFSQPANSKKMNYRVASCLYKDNQNNIWIGMSGKGIKKYNTKTGMFKDYISSPGNPHSLSNNYVSCIYQDNLKNIWIGTFWGLNKYNPTDDTFTRSTHDSKKSYSIISDGIYDIVQDNAGLIWVATSGGISKFYQPASGFQYIQEKSSGSSKGLTSGSIMSLFIDKKDNIWIGSFSGVDKLNSDGKLVAHLQKEEGNSNGLSSNFIRSVFIDHKGIAWIGTNDNGLNRFDPATKKNRIFTYDNDNENSISNNGITAICEDSNGSLWFGTWWGLNRFDRRTEKFFRYLPDSTNPNGLKSEAIRSLYADSKGLLWIGSDRTGLNILDIKSNTFIYSSSNPNQKNLLSDNCINIIYESQDGMMWIGTSNGLDRINPKTKSTKIYLKKDGLAGNSVSGIQEDKDGYIWIATDKGLSKLDRKNNHFINYSKRNGLKSIEFTPFISGKTKNGTIYFGSSGLMYFNSNNIKDEQLTSPVVFTNLKIYNETVPVTKDGVLTESITTAKTVRIPKEQDVITFEFALLDYFDVKRNTFKYKLNGYDVEWNMVGARNQATYTNLPPGEYTFIVKATNNNGIKNEREASIEVVIVPAFYQTWWFKIAIVLAMILGTLLMIHEHTRKITKQNRILENRVFERTKVLDKTINELNLEINERKKAELKVQASLDEKEVLLKEIHHRVKNNLQVISSLLYLQSFSIKDEETLNLFEDSQNRIKSMALIHEKLYQSKNLAKIDFGEYVSSLLEHLTRSLSRSGVPVNIVNNINNITLNLDNAILCGLVVNEIITNAFKYAFPLEWVKQKKNATDNIVEIKMENLGDNNYTLTIFDNGIGLPKDLDIDTTESLGLKIVKSMVQQLNGSLEIHGNDGTKYSITFVD